MLSVTQVGRNVEMIPHFFLLALQQPSSMPPCPSSIFGQDGSGVIGPEHSVTRPMAVLFEPQVSLPPTLMQQDTMHVFMPKLGAVQTSPPHFTGSVLGASSQVNMPPPGGAVVPAVAPDPARVPPVPAFAPALPPLPALAPALPPVPPLAALPPVSVCEPSVVGSSSSPHATMTHSESASVIGRDHRPKRVCMLILAFQARSPQAPQLKFERTQTPEATCCQRTLRVWIQSVTSHSI